MSGSGCRTAQRLFRVRWNGVREIKLLLLPKKTINLTCQFRKCSISIIRTSSLLPMYIINPHHTFYKRIVHLLNKCSCQLCCQHCISHHALNGLSADLWKCLFSSNDSQSAGLSWQWRQAPKQGVCLIISHTFDGIFDQQERNLDWASLIKCHQYNEWQCVMCGYVHTHTHTHKAQS